MRTLAAIQDSHDRNPPAAPALPGPSPAVATPRVCRPAPEKRKTGNPGVPAIAGTPLQCTSVQYSCLRR